MNVSSPDTPKRISSWRILGYAIGEGATSITIGGISNFAMGFELCQGYEDRSRLRGIRNAFFMVINLVLGGLAWSLFFRDRTGPDGARVDGTVFAEKIRKMLDLLSSVWVRPWRLACRF